MFRGNGKLDKKKKLNREIRNTYQEMGCYDYTIWNAISYEKKNTGT